MNDFWKLKEKNENKKNENYDNSSDNEDEEFEEKENSNVVYDRPEKYEKFDIIFCDDLNGWSK